MAENAAHLSERSALSELFSIRHVDGFPSINGFRLGRAPDDKRRLHWNEINAAWGEVSGGPYRLPYTLESKVWVGVQDVCTVSSPIVAT